MNIELWLFKKFGFWKVKEDVFSGHISHLYHIHDSSLDNIITSILMFHYRQLKQMHFIVLKSLLFRNSLVEYGPFINISLMLHKFVLQDCEMDK